MTDEELMLKLKSGNLDCAGDLFERYHKRIYHFLLKLTGNPSDSEDLTQNVFVRMIRYRNSYRKGNSFEAWLFRIARNLFYDHVKDRSKNSELYDRDMILMHGETSEEGEEKIRILNLALMELTHEERFIIVLNRFQKVKYEDIGEILSLTVASIKVKVHRALHKLRGHYEEIEKKESQ